MRADELRDLPNASPFRSSTVCPGCDRAATITAPEFVMLTPEGQTLIVAQDLSNAVEMVDEARITRVEIETS